MRAEGRGPTPPRRHPVSLPPAPRARPPPVRVRLCFERACGVVREPRAGRPTRTRAHPARAHAGAVCGGRGPVAFPTPSLGDGSCRILHERPPAPAAAPPRCCAADARASTLCDPLSWRRDVLSSHTAQHSAAQRNATQPNRTRTHALRMVRNASPSAAPLRWCGLLLCAAAASASAGAAGSTDDHAKLSRMGLSPESLIGLIQSSNIMSPGGELSVGREQLSLLALQCEATRHRY